MGSFTVRQGRRYRATISLGLLESFAGNDIVAEKLSEAGFVNVEVTGSGSLRRAEADWPHADATADMPSQIRDVTEIQLAAR